MIFDKNAGAGNVPSRMPVRRSSSLLSVLLFLAAIFCFVYVGRWLVVEDPLNHAQAIAVLSGRMPMRALEAATLYRAGYAPEVWLTRSTEPGKSLEAMGVPYFGEEYYDTKILVHEGVPASAIHVLEPPILNTADEIETIQAALNTAPVHTVIIVTSKPHTRRVRALWRLLNHGQAFAIVRAASLDPYDPARWWRTTRDTLDVVRELLGLVNAWLGLPLGRS